MKCEKKENKVFRQTTIKRTSGNGRKAILAIQRQMPILLPTIKSSTRCQERRNHVVELFIRATVAGRAGKKKAAVALMESQS